MALKKNRLNQKELTKKSGVPADSVSAGNSLSSKEMKEMLDIND